MMSKRLKDELNKADNLKAVEEIDRTLSPYLRAMLIETAQRAVQLNINFQKYKGNKVPCINLMTTDGSERAALAEQIIIYVLFLQQKKGNQAAKQFLEKEIKSDNADLISLESQKLNVSEEIKSSRPVKIGYYSFEWLNAKSKPLLDAVRDSLFGTERERDELDRINQWAPKQFWGVGHVQAALNQLVVLNGFFKNNVDNYYHQDIIRYQAHALFNIKCARRFLSYRPLVLDESDDPKVVEEKTQKAANEKKTIDYSNSIFEMIIPGRDIKQFLNEYEALVAAAAINDDKAVPDPSQDNDKLLEALELQITAKLKEKLFNTDSLDVDVEKYFQQSVSAILSVEKSQIKSMTETNMTQTKQNLFQTPSGKTEDKSGLTESNSNTLSGGKG